jgi:hypothetical protein
MPMVRRINRETPVGSSYCYCKPLDNSILSQQNVTPIKNGPLGPFLCFIVAYVYNLQRLNQVHPSNIG